MRRWKILTFVVAVVTFLATLSSDYSEPIKRLLFGRYDVRLFASWNEPQRSQMVTILNVGKETSPPLEIKIDLRHGTVTDFVCSAAADGSPVSFLATFAELDLTRGKIQADRILGFLDRHNDSASLGDIEESFKAQLKAALQSAGHNPRDIMQFLASPGIHQQRVARCTKAPAADASCRIEKELVRWEHTVTGIRRDAIDRWRERTGVAVSFLGGELSPTGGMRFLTTLGPGETRFLSFRYGPDSVTTSGSITSNMTPVVSENDLKASSFSLMARYEPSKLIFCTLLLLVSLLFAWPSLTGLSSLKTHQVFNLALKTDGTDNEEVWELAYHRVRYELINEFRQQCAIFGKPNVHATGEELFEFIRDRLRIDYGTGQLREFSKSAEVIEAIRFHIRDLAINA